jgi:hypothetical protein
MTADELIANLEDYDGNTEVKVHDIDGNLYIISHIQLEKNLVKKNRCLMIEIVD